MTLNLVQGRPSTQGDSYPLNTTTICASVGKLDKKTIRGTYATLYTNGRCDHV